jgi:hypothetical protein
MNAGAVTFATAGVYLVTFQAPEGIANGPAVLKFAVNSVALNPECLFVSTDTVPISCSLMVAANADDVFQFLNVNGVSVAIDAPVLLTILRLQ